MMLYSFLLQITQAFHTHDCKYLKLWLYFFSVTEVVWEGEALAIDRAEKYATKLMLQRGNMLYSVFCGIFNLHFNLIVLLLLAAGQFLLGWLASNLSLLFSSCYNKVIKLF